MPPADHRPELGISEDHVEVESAIRPLQLRADGKLATEWRCVPITTPPPAAAFAEPATDEGADDA